MQRSTPGLRDKGMNRRCEFSKVFTNRAASGSSSIRCEFPEGVHQSNLHQTQLQPSDTKFIHEASFQDAQQQYEDNSPSTMTSPSLAVAKSKRFGCLLEVNRTITVLRDICNDPEEQEPDRVATATARLKEAGLKYEEAQQDVLGLAAEDQVDDELTIFFETEKIRDNAIDKARKISRKGKDTGKEKEKTDDESGEKFDTRPNKPTPQSKEIKEMGEADTPAEAAAPAEMQPPSAPLEIVT